MDDDPEEYVKMKYARDDEIPKGWAIRDLSRPVVSKLGFYPASEFGVLTKLIQQVSLLVHRARTCKASDRRMLRVCLACASRCVLEAKGLGAFGGCLFTCLTFFADHRRCVLCSQSDMCGQSNLGFRSQSVTSCRFCLQHSLRLLQPKHMVFPKAMHVSRNHYKQSWSFKTYRRIKNVIVLMDWVPDVTALKPEPTPAGRHVSQSTLAAHP